MLGEEESGFTGLRDPWLARGPSMSEPTVRRGQVSGPVSGRTGSRVICLQAPVVPSSPSLPLLPSHPDNHAKSPENKVLGSPLGLTVCHINAVDTSGGKETGDRRQERAVAVDSLSFPCEAPTVLSCATEHFITQDAGRERAVSLQNSQCPIRCPDK
ncbi:hypothetical protein P7K49_035767 [Saguinus oedipus]|uniref:Uncharacterized protein n=1 Tax=Saguinus oedipus TaxID=9490 RepID=A0ABQ9TNK7_SAGOE|nr:hypothetical protein P7K49_035767 [Saguinus oedipus]